MTTNIFETAKEVVEEVKLTKKEAEGYSSFTTLYNNVAPLNKTKDTLKYRKYLKKHGYDLKKVINNLAQHDVYLSTNEPFNNEPLYVAPKGILFEDLEVKFVRDTMGVTKELLEMFCSSVTFNSENVLVVLLDDMFFELDRKVQEFAVLNKLAIITLTRFSEGHEMEDFNRQVRYGYTPLLIYVADYLTSLSMENSEDALTSLYALYCQTHSPSFRERYFNLTNILVGEELKSGPAYETLVNYLDFYYQITGKEVPTEAYKFDYPLSHVNIEANLQTLREIQVEAEESKEEKKHGGLDTVIPIKTTANRNEEKKEEVVGEKKSIISEAVDLHDTLVEDSIPDVKPTTPAKKRTSSTTRKRTTTAKAKKTEEVKPDTQEESKEDK